MAFENQQINITIQASAALTDLRAGLGELYKAVGTTGDVTGDDDLAIGILTQGADDAGHAGICVFGVCKYVADGAVTNGQGLTVTTSGYMTAATSGGHCVGRNLISAVASGAVGTGIFNFANPFALVNSNGNL